MSTLIQHPDPEELMAWSDQELDAPTADRVHAHVETCASCRSRADGFGSVRAGVDRWPIERAPASIRAAVLAAIAAQPHGPGRPTSLMPQVSFWRLYRWQVLATTVLLALGFIATEVSLCGAVLCRARTADSDLPEAQGPVIADFAAWWQALPHVDLQIPNDGAAVVVAWFVDYECPACAVSDPAYTNSIEQYVAANPGSVKFVVRDWPWNTDCNPNIGQTLRGHEASCAAAVAVRLAKERGTAVAMKAWLFSHEGGATIDEVRRAAESIANVHDFDLRYTSEIDALRRELATLASARVAATPSCFINGVRANDDHGRLLSPQNLGRAIEYELKKGRR
jgi:protein-disulfide isomerase